MALILGLACMAYGCTHRNVILNPLSRDVAHLDANHTRAAVMARLIPTDDHAEPGGRPVIVPAASTQPYVHDEDGIFVGLAISGGGSRSANFAAACMFELQKLGLLQRVDYISSVSGGSLTAAYYCVADDSDWSPGVVQQKLTYGFANDLVGQILLPWNWLALTLTSWDRSDILGDIFQRQLFTTAKGHGLTFADLRPDRPRLLINATNLQSGRRFVFCNESFDQLNADLGKYPLGLAVAASAAAPVVLHQVTLRDYSTRFKQYVHLIDGGAADNLGVLSLLEAYEAQIQQARDSGRPDPYPRGLMLLVIDAKTRYDAKLSDSPDTGLIDSLRYGANLSTNNLLNRVSSATLADLIIRFVPDGIVASDIRQQMRKLESDGVLHLRDRYGHGVHVVHLALGRLSDMKNLPFPSFSETVNNISTYFNIRPTEAYRLYQAAELLVDEKFRSTLEEMAGELRGATTGPALPSPATTAHAEMPHEPPARHGQP